MSLMSGEMGTYQSFHPHPLNLRTVNILVFFLIHLSYVNNILQGCYANTSDFVHPSNDSLQWAQLARMTNTQPTSSQDSFRVGGPNFLKGSFWYCWNQSTFYDSTGRESDPFPISTVHPALEMTLVVFQDPHLCRVVSYISWLVTISYSIFTKKTNQLLVGWFVL